MKLDCPHGSQRVSLDAEVLVSLGAASGFECPACAGHIPLPGAAADPAEMPTEVSGTLPPGNWAAPDAAELARAFDSRYRIDRLLGRGGMGAVYAGFATRLERRVAIKILPMETGSNPEILARFELAAKAMKADGVKQCEVENHIIDGSGKVSINAFRSRCNFKNVQVKILDPVARTTPS